MSAYIVTDKTITAICEGLHHYNIGIDNPRGNYYDREDYRDPDDKADGYFKWFAAMHEEDIRSPRTAFRACGQALVNMNYMSVNARYDEDTAPHTFKPVYHTVRRDYGSFSMTDRIDYTPAEIIGAVRCYRYQSCECVEYGRSGIPAALERLVTCIAEDLAKQVYGDNDGRGYYDIHDAPATIDTADDYKSGEQMAFAI